MRVLFITHRLPYAPNRGDRIRAYHMLRTLGASAEIDVISLVHDAAEAARVEDVARFVSSVRAVRVTAVVNRVRALASLATARPLTHVLLHAPALPEAIASSARQQPDVVLAYCTGVAPAAFDPVLRGTPVVLDTVDVDSGKWGELAARTHSPLRWIYRREARLLSQFESDAARHAFATIVVNARERDALTRLAPSARIEVIENGVDVQALTPSGPPTDSSDVIFCGVLNYAPNVEAISWLVRHVWPLVRARADSARLVLVGSSPTREIQQLGRNGVAVVTGSVADVRPYLWRAAVSVAPLQVARGVQNKVLEAVAAGLPAVITPAVRDGLPLEVLPACTIASEPSAFADAVVNLLRRSAAERRQLAARASLESLTWENRLRRLPELLANAAREGPTS
jgi:sugar transferase (PEP-CTERM/EpsH1 system associated)